MAPSTYFQDAIRQTRPFGSAAQEGVIGLLRTADVVRRAFQAVVEPHGITAAQYNVLRVLRGAGPDGLPTLAIAERLIEESPGITRMLDRLQAKGLIRRERGLEDRRLVRCRLTERGRALLAELDPLVVSADDDILKALGPRQQRQLVKLLETVCRRLEG